MKKLFLYLITVPVLLMSCRKENVLLKEEATEKVRLSLSVSPGAEALTATGATLRDLVNQFTLILYNEAGQEVLRQTQVAAHPEFGTLSLEVPKATYRVVAIASNSAFSLNEFYPSGSPAVLPYNTAYFEYTQGVPVAWEKWYKTTDTFYSSVMYTVTENAELDITLQRIVGKLDVVVKDADQFRLTIHNEATGYSFQSQSSMGGITNDDKLWRYGTKDEPISLYILRTNAPLDVEIYGNGKTVRLNVPVHKNQRTFVSGTMSEIAKPANLSVFAVVTTWDADSILHTF